MRIAYMVGGIGVTDELILSKLVEYGFDTYLVYTRDEPADLGILKKLKVKLVDVSRFKYLPKLFRWLIFGYETISYVRRIKPDIVFSQGIQGQGLFAVLSKVRPVLLMPWGSDWAIVANKNIIMRLWSRYVVNRADLIQIDCEVGKGVILELSKGKVKPDDIWVFPQGIDLSIVKLIPDIRKTLRQELGWMDKKILIITRKFKSVYGIDIFLKALSMIVQQDRDVRAIIVGFGPLEHELKSLSISLGLKEFVKFTGRVNRWELVNYLNVADIYVSTSYSDGTSLSLLEALVVGLPAVVTDVPANLEWVRDGYNGFIAKRGDHKDVEEALLKLLKNVELWPIFRERNIMLAKKKADWDKNFEKFVRMFEALSQKKFVLK
jgi:glycosyltransferase involved in cell wall biosynthesis